MKNFDQQLSAYAEESAFSLTDWQAAAKAMRAWLETRGLTISDEALLQYIACCAEGQACNVAHASLEQSTLDYLNAYGCASAAASKA